MEAIWIPTQRDFSFAIHFFLAWCCFFCAVFVFCFFRHLQKKHVFNVLAPKNTYFSWGINNTKHIVWSRVGAQTMIAEPIDTDMLWLACHFLPDSFLHVLVGLILFFLFLHSTKTKSFALCFIFVVFTWLQVISPNSWLFVPPWNPCEKFNFDFFYLRKKLLKYQKMPVPNPFLFPLPLSPFPKPCSLPTRHRPPWPWQLGLRPASWLGLS